MHSSGSPKDIPRTLVALADQGRACVLAVVLATDGSTPCKAGAKAILDAGGVILGTIGGGAVEVATQRRAAETIEAGRPVVLDFALDGRAVDSAACGGAMRVLIDPTTSRHRAAYAAAAAMLGRRQRGVLLTTVRGRRTWEVAVECLAEHAAAPGLGFPGGEAVRSVLEQGEPGRFVSEPDAQSERVEALVEPLVANPVLVIVGGGHVGQALAAQASMVGFDIAVIDDRPGFTRPELFPEGATTCCGSIGDEVAGFPIGRDTYVVIVTHSHRHDAQALAACIHEPAAYVGMIGSRRKVSAMRKDFIETARATPEEFDRVCAPIGLDIGAATVPEIAAAIVAQLIAVRRKGPSPRTAAGQGGL